MEGEFVGGCDILLQMHQNGELGMEIIIFIFLSIFLLFLTNYQLEEEKELVASHRPTRPTIGGLKCCFKLKFV